MTIDPELQSAHAALVQQFDAVNGAQSNDNNVLASIGSQLAMLKVMLTERDILYPQQSDVQQHKDCLLYTSPSPRD